MKILFLDDQDNRHKIFIGSHKSHDIISAYTADEAIEFIRNQSPFDLVSLDHDLGGVYLPSDENSGYAVAEYIAGMDKEKLPGEIVVHSWNESGAEKMIKKLGESGIDALYRPFQVFPEL
jgi:hypothetical protein